MSDSPLQENQEKADPNSGGINKRGLAISCGPQVGGTTTDLALPPNFTTTSLLEVSIKVRLACRYVMGRFHG